MSRKMAKSKSKTKPRNYALDSGVVRFSRSAMYHKKAIYKFVKNKKAKTTAKPKAVFVEKKVGGAKNGGTRMVRVKKLANDYPTAARPAKKLHQSCFKSHARRLRSSITPGVVAIVLAGVHKGKHVVILKQLASGLLLVTGPMSVNGCPLRRINQRFVIATKTKLDVSGVKVPESINDEYFARVKAEGKKKEGDIFDIKKHPEAHAMKQYLNSCFRLSKGEYPHAMVF